MTFSGERQDRDRGPPAHRIDGDRPTANFEQVSEDISTRTGAKILEGRDFNDDDTDSKLPVAIVNSAFAQSISARRRAIGRRFRTGRQQWPALWAVADDRWSGDQRCCMQAPFNQPNVDDTGFYIPRPISRRCLDRR